MLCKKLSGQPCVTEDLRISYIYDGPRILSPKVCFIILIQIGHLQPAKLLQHRNTFFVGRRIVSYRWV